MVREGEETRLLNIKQMEIYIEYIQYKQGKNIRDIQLSLFTTYVQKPRLFGGAGGGGESSGS